MKKIRVLHISEAYGGGIKTILENYKKFNNKEIFNFFLTNSENISKRSRQKNHHFFKNRSRIINLIKLFFLIPLYILKTKPNIIHLHSTIAGLIGKIYSIFFLSKKFFYQPHGLFHLYTENKIYKFLIILIENIMSNFSCTNIASSESEYKEMKKYTKINKLILINNGVDISKKKIINKINKKIKVITVGRICYQKDPKKFFDVYKSLKMKKVEFIWAGAGKYKNYENFFKKEGVTVTGWLSQKKIDKLMLNSDIFILLSRYEGMSLSLLTAQSLGLPCVVSNVIGNKDLVKNNYTGFKSNNLKTIIKKTELLINSKNLRIKIGNQSRNLIIKNYNINAQIKKLNLQYKKSICF
jgi:glycosyltransferase involved in cell wall biosynthesis